MTQITKSIYGKVSIHKMTDCNFSATGVFYYKFTMVLLNVLLASIIAIILYSLNKGFDFTDEGEYLLRYKYTDLYKGGIYNYHIMITRLTDWLNPGIIQYRWMTLILTILSSFALAFGLYRWLNANYTKKCFYKNFPIIFCFISIGNFLYYFPGLQTVNNNTLTNFFLQVATGLVLYLFSFDSSRIIQSKKGIFLFTAIGFICAFSFFVKFSTGSLQLLIYFIIFYFYLGRHDFKSISIAFIAYFSGFAAGIIIYYLFFQGFNEWIYNFKMEYFIVSGNHPPLPIIMYYILDTLSLIKSVIMYFSWLMIFPVCIFLNNYFPRYFNEGKKKYIINSVLFLSGIFFICEIIYFRYYRSYFANDHISAVFYIAIILLQISLLLAVYLTGRVGILHLLKNNFHKLLMVILLLITPFMGAVGTANSIFLNILFHAAPWFGAILILSIHLSDRIRKEFILTSIIIITSLVTTSQIIDGNAFIPYHATFMNKSDLFQQTLQIDDISRLDGVYVDADTKNFLLELKQLLENNNFKKGYPILGYYIPGVVYLLEGTSPGTPYYFNLQRDITAFEYLAKNDSPPIIMISDEYSINNDLLKIMRVNHINFPCDYCLKGKVYCPHMNSYLKIYFPKKYLI